MSPRRDFIKIPPAAKQARCGIDGLEADVLTLALAGDIVKAKVRAMC